MCILARNYEVYHQLSRPVLALPEISGKSPKRANTSAEAPMLTMAETQAVKFQFKGYSNTSSYQTNTADFPSLGDSQAPHWHLQLLTL